MRRQLLPALRLLLVFTVILGIAYPLLVLGIGQLAFKDKANGSMLEANGKQVGSTLIGQSFSSDKYFAGRPSAAGNAASGSVTDGKPADPADPTLWSSGGSNLGPTNGKLIGACYPVPKKDDSGTVITDDQGNAVNETNPDGSPVCDPNTVPQRTAAYRKANGLADDAQVPVDAVTASASGLDPHISVENARLQAARVAKARGTSVDQVNKLIDANTEGASLGFLGLPGVNVLRLNLALDGSPPS